MISIVVGPDACGKTTYIKGLQSLVYMPVIKMSAPKTKEEQENMYEEYKKLFTYNDNFIMDRSFICEMVYGPLFRGKSYITDEQLLKLENLLVDKDAQIIHLTDDPKAIFERFKITGEDFVTTLEQVEYIVDKYFEVLEKITRIPVYTINVFEEVGEY